MLCKNNDSFNLLKGGLVITVYIYNYKGVTYYLQLVKYLGKKKTDLFLDLAESPDILCEPFTTDFEVFKSNNLRYVAMNILNIGVNIVRDFFESLFYLSSERAENLFTREKVIASRSKKLSPSLTKRKLKDRLTRSKKPILVPELPELYYVRVNLDWYEHEKHKIHLYRMSEVL